jgi:iron(III) transport system ATP-binding protein
MNFLNSKLFAHSSGHGGGVGTPLELETFGYSKGESDLLALSVESISHSFSDGSKVLQDFSISMRAGEIVSLIGPSGCGKTTTLRLIAGLERLQKGSITIGGVLAGTADWHMPAERRDVGMMFQDYALFPHLSVLDNVLFGLGDLSKPLRQERARDLLSKVGISELALRKPSTLSGGQQQRVALARALAPYPRLLLLDEPFSDLDTELRRKIRADAIKIIKSLGVGALLVTHDPEEALIMSDKIAVMRGGRVEQMGSPMALYEKPISTYVARLFSETNEIPGVVKGGRVETALGNVSADGLSDGQQVVVMVRPEHILSGKMAEVAGGAAEGQVSLLKQLGREVLVEVKLSSGLEIILRTGVENAPQEGTSILIALDPGRLNTYVN